MRHCNNCGWLFFDCANQIDECCVYQNYKIFKPKHTEKTGGTPLEKARKYIGIIINYYNNGKTLFPNDIKEICELYEQAIKELEDKNEK
jgi:hypothetical protein